MAGLIEESAVVLRKIDQTVTSPRISEESLHNLITTPAVYTVNRQGAVVAPPNIQ